MKYSVFGVNTCTYFSAIIEVYDYVFFSESLQLNKKGI